LIFSIKILDLKPGKVEVVKSVGILLLLLLCQTNLPAQAYQPFFQQFSIDDGLSNTNITALWTDSRGIVWIGTPYGLNRFDGQRFKSYTAEEDGLCQNAIQKIIEDQTGNLWIAGGASEQEHTSICIFNPISDKAYSLEAFIDGPVPFDFKKTRLIGGHLRQVLFREEQESVYRFYLVEKRQIKVLFDVLKEDFILDPTDQMVRQADGSYMGSFQADTSKNKNAGFVFFDERGNVLSIEETVQDGIPHIHTDGKHLYVETKKMVNDRVSLSLSKDGKPLGEVPALSNADMYTYSQNDFVHIRYDGFYFYRSYFGEIQMLTYFYDGSILPSGDELFSDMGGGIWYTNGESLIRLNLQDQYFYMILNDGDQKSNNAIRGIHISENEKQLYASSSEFLHQVRFLDGRQEKIAITKDSLKIKGLTTLLMEDPILWIATQKQGLIQYKPSNRYVRNFSFPLSAQETGEVRQLFRSTDKQLWVGTNLGLFLLDTVQNELVPFQGYDANYPLLAESEINAFHQNDRGMWLCTSTGLYLIDLKQEKVAACFNSQQTGPYHIPAENITHLHEDTAGIFWITTIGQGLVQWDPKSKRSRSFTKANSGFANNILYAVYEDQFEQLWLSTKLGLIRFDKKSYEHSTYYKPDGKSYIEFNAFAHHKGKDGRLYFGSQNGLLMFDPENFNSVPIDDSLQIIAVTKTKRQDNELLNVSGQFLEKGRLELVSSDKHISLTLLIPNYNNPVGKQYSYRLKGHHEDWIYQNNSEINLSGFPYGKYEVEIRGKLANSKTWLHFEKPILLHVVRPMYLRWWFIGLVILAISGFIYFLLRRNTRKLLKRQEELETILAERTEQIRKDKVQLEEQAEELRALDKVKSSFFANVSHELRTPLTLILGPLSYLLDQPEDWNKKEIREQLLVMQDNGKNLLKLVEEILDLSKLEAHKLELQEEPTSVVSFFEHIFAVFEPQFQSQGLEYELAFHLSDNNLFVLLDRKKMKKVLFNFLSNAIKFTPKGGKISLDIIEKEAHIQIIVSDSGKGVHPKDLPFIFERFYQSRQADQKRQGGTGIGLALVSEFAALMHGRAYAESELNVGSRFYFEWPKQVTAAFPTAITELEITNGEPDIISSIGTDFTILVVEDTPDMRQFVCNILGKHYTVLSANNGIEGLELLRKSDQAIHLVVSDVMMPEMDGFEMLKEIKSDDTLGSIPVVMLTALAGESDRLNALTIGVDDYLTKPFSVIELLARVQNLLYNYHQRQQWQQKTKGSSNGEHIAGPKQSGSTPVASKALTKADKDWIHNVRKMVEASLPDDLIKIEDLATHHHLGVRQLSRKLKSLTGLSARRFIREVQLEVARKILEDGQVLSVSEVAYRSGFDYHSTFSDLFRKRYGKSPEAFLKDVMNGGV
jgi:signal transduction histidine kinase/CheY-like chemotaxis protein/AraC-like DNA-binding protein/sugar lactone lactonase YvrE